MSKELIYTALEGQMLTYGDLTSVPVVDDGEPLTALQESDALMARQLRSEMLPITGTQIYVRETVQKMLGTASLNLMERANVQLQIGYGYRALSIQEANFNKQRQRMRGTVNDAMLDEATHRYVAVPQIAGHPTGGAVDVRMLGDGKPVDCGTAMWEFVPDTYTFSPYISREQRDSRLLLRAAMTEVGFAPFDGEWWHFSYGDKEWARYYGKPQALYEQVEFSTAGRSQV